MFVPVAPSCFSFFSLFLLQSYGFLKFPLFHLSHVTPPLSLPSISSTLSGLLSLLIYGSPSHFQFWKKLDTHIPHTHPQTYTPTHTHPPPTYTVTHSHTKHRGPSHHFYRHFYTHTQNSHTHTFSPLLYTHIKLTEPLFWPLSHTQNSLSTYSPTAKFAG